MSVDIVQFEQAQGIQFRNKELLRTAFIHSSFVNETDDEGVSDNERLEFLGDSILEFVVSEALYVRFPDLTEGELTSVRASLVRRETLARYARQLELGSYLLLGHGEDESGGRKRMATLCATFEAVVGAIYLDQGLEAVRRFVLPLIEEDLTRLQPQSLGKDPKSRLQEWAQSDRGMAPKYRVVATSGPDHAKVFTMQVSIGDHVYGLGQGRSKQEASQSAAAMALHRLGQDAPEYIVDPDLEAQLPPDPDLEDSPPVITT